MWNEIIHLVVSLGATTLLLVVPFIPVAWLLFREAPWPKILLSAAVIGTCLQSITGLLWTHLVGSFTIGEVILLGFLWAALLLLARRFGTPLQPWDQPADKGNHFFLAVILLAALAVRAVHPLEAAFLGQSDAYTHLHYLRDIVARAHLTNPAYPPGYHWVVAVPVLVLSIEPYVMVRFVGALFGAALVLSVYVFLLQSFGKNAALFGSFLVAGFPPMMLLMKTGVGGFANQMGLFLVPVVFLFYLELINKHDGYGNTMVMLLLALVGLVSATPMMLFHLLIVLTLERVIALFRTPRSWLPHTARIGLVVIAALTFIVFHFSQIGPGQRIHVSRAMVEYGQQTQQAERLSDSIEQAVSDTSRHWKKITAFVIKSPYFVLLVDYVSVKRRGLGSYLYDTLALLLSILFSLSLGFGLWKGLNQYTLIGLWGLLTTLETATGLLQFSSYQREGWSLLIATCCLGGIIAARVYEVGVHIALVRYGTVLLITGSIAWTLLHPPHHPIRSNAEDPLVRSVRFAGRSYEQMEAGCREPKSALCDLVPLLWENLPLTLVTRRFTGWKSQGEIAPNVLQPWSERKVLIIDDQPLDKALRPGNQYLVLIDETIEISQEHLSSAFQMLTPSMVEASRRKQTKLFKINQTILESIEKLPEDEWLVKEVSISDALTGIVIVPQKVD